MFALFMINWWLLLQCMCEQMCAYTYAAAQATMLIINKANIS